MLRLSSNIIGNSDDKISSPHELVLTNRQAANLRKGFSNNSSTYKAIKNSIIQDDTIRRICW